MNILIKENMKRAWFNIMDSVNYYGFLSGERALSIWGLPDGKDPHVSVSICLAREERGRVIKIQLYGAYVAVLKYDRKTGVVSLSEWDEELKTYRRNKEAKVTCLCDVGELFLVLSTTIGYKCIETITYNDGSLEITHGDGIKSIYTFSPTPKSIPVFS